MTALVRRQLADLAAELNRRIVRRHQLAGVGCLDHVENEIAWRRNSHVVFLLRWSIIRPE